MSAIGGGDAWPRLAIWGEGSRIGFLSRSDPPGVVGPVRYLTDALVYTSATTFESMVDAFLTNAIHNFVSKADSPALQSQFDALKCERSDPEAVAWRRMEARLGFDPDEAPQGLMAEMSEFADAYGGPGVEEAAMATPGARAANVLETEINAGRQSRVKCRFPTAIKAVGPIKPGNQAPWELAEDAASRLRNVLGRAPGPLPNAELASILETSRVHFKTAARAPASNLPYGLRLSVDGESSHQVVVKSRWSGDRRFELTRALGDAIWASGDRLGPLAASKSARQKFQRAFAQSLLCPYGDLLAYIGTEQATDNDMTAAAAHFHVSEGVVRTVLVNKGRLNRERLDPIRPYVADIEQLEDWVEAA